MKLFEGLNSEKPSPIFLSLARNRNAGKMSQIKNHNGADIVTDIERTEFVVNFSKNCIKNR